MKITKSYLKQLIKEELQEFKGAKPVQTGGIIFTYMLDGNIHTFDRFDIDKVPIVGGGDELSTQEKLDIVTRKVCYVPEHGFVNGEMSYDFIRDRLIEQVPELSSLPIAKKRLPLITSAYKAGKSTYLPVSIATNGSKYGDKGLSLKPRSENEKMLDRVGSSDKNKLSNIGSGAGISKSRYRDPS